MILYVVHGNTYYDGYGHEENIFGIFTEKDFQKKENGAVFMTDDARKAFLSAWQKRKQETLTHPYLKERVQWGMVAFSQAMLLSRYLRGDLDAYPPFLWK